MFKIFIPLDKHQRFKIFHQSNDIYQAGKFVQ